MMYLTAFFLSPIYFMIRGKWGSFFINSLFYGVALLLLVTFIFSWLAPIPWFIAAVHALMDYSKHLREEHATDLAKKMAYEMRQPPTNP